MAPNDTLNMNLVPYTPEMEAADLAREAENLAGNGVEDVDAGRVTEQPEQVRVPAPEPGERKVIQQSPQDAKREAIAARFKPGGVTNADAPFDGDLTRPENMYGSAAQEHLEPAAGADDITGERIAPVVEQPRADAPAKRKLTVRGQTVEMTDDEILAAAQKTLAGDSYLEDARAILDEAKTIRAGKDPRHPEGQEGAQDGLDASRTDGSQHPEDDLAAVVEQIQFGDPKEAAKLLRDAISKEAGKTADQGHQARLFNNDLARSQKALDAFKLANPDLEKDEIASLAIERNMYKLYREDIVNLGILDEAQIPQDPKTLANWHRFYKVNGHTMRDTPTLLAKAKEAFVTWRGAPPNPNPQVPPKAPPRVAVNVDRDARRQAIPLQPSRAVAPRRDAVVNQQATTGSDIVKNMRRARGQPVA